MSIPADIAGASITDPSPAKTRRLLRPISLRILVSGLYVLLAVSIVAFAIYSVSEAEKLLLDQEWQELEATADNYERHINTLLDGYGREAALVASRTRLRRLTARSDLQPGDAASRTMGTILGDARDSNSDIASISVFDHVGRILADTDQARVGVIDADFHDLDHPIHQDPSAVSWQTRIENRQVFVQVYTPMWLEHRLVGTLRTVFRPNPILQAVRDIDIRYSGDIALGMVDLDGNLHLVTGIREQRQTLDTNSSRPQDLSIPMKMALFGRETRLDGLVEQYDARVITVTRYLERVGWGLVARLDRGATHAAIAPLYTNFMLLAALLIAVVGFSAIYIARRLDHANAAVQRQLLATGISERRFRSIFDASPSGLLIVRDDGRIDMANSSAEKILGFEPGGLTDRPIEELVPRELRARHRLDRERFSRVPVAREMGKGRNLMARKHDGSEVPVEIGLIPLVTDQGQMILASLTDRSEAFQARLALERHAAALQRSNDELDQFAYIASHDLRAPLRGISQLTEFVEEDATDTLDADSRQHLAMIRSRTRRLDVLLSNLLQYSRIGRRESEFCEVDTLAAVNEAAELYLADNGFELQVDGELPPIHAPKPLLDLVLRNLVMNAVKHHDRDHGTIRISAVEHAEYHHLEIADDGPGIPEKYHRKVFQMFQTLKRRDEIEGSGMGLTLVQKAMQHCNGEVTLRSDGERGAIFRLSFPKP